jgi:hypothetical protein
MSIKGDSIQTFWTRQVLTNWTNRKIQSKSLESDKKNKQVEHTGWFHPKVLYQTLSLCSICKYFLSGLKLLDWITSYVQLVSTSSLVHNFWMESPCMFNLSVLHVWFKTWIEPPCMFNLSVLHVWFKTFGWNHPVCSSCQYFMSGLKRWFHPSFEPDMKNRQVEYTGWFHLTVLKQTWSTDKLNIKGELLDWITLYVQLVCSSCLIQNF